MPDFRYQSLTTTGEARHGIVTAADRQDAVRQLLGRGETATQVAALIDGPPAPGKPARTSAAGAGTGAERGAARRAGSRRRKPTINRSDMANLVRELATALEAGLPLMQALRTVRRQASGRGMPVILDHLIERVEAGDPLHMAAREYGRPFNDLMVGMLRAADASGNMSEVLHQLADLLERQTELRREVLGATLYPMIVAGLIVMSVVVLITVLVPKLIAPMAGSFTLPWPTRTLLGVAHAIQAYWLYALVAAAAATVAWRMWSSVPANRLRIDRLKLRLPLLGRLLRDVAVARFTRTLGTLSSAGIPILDALRITEHTLGNTAMMKAIEQVQEQVTAGRPLTEPLERSGLFPPLLVQVVGLGERSGRLEGMLLHAASAFDRRVNTSIKLFTKALPPLLLIVMASVGGFVLAAILLPLLELQSMIG
jgi:type II secretory pathway component PulF